VHSATQSQDHLRIGEGFGPDPRRTARSTRMSPSARAVRPPHRLPAMGRRSSTGAQIGDSGTGLHLGSASSPPSITHHERQGPAASCCAMQDGVLNLARVKMRDQRGLAHVRSRIQPARRGHLVRQGGAARRQTTRAVAARTHPQVKGWENPSRRLHLFITQAPVWSRSATDRRARLKTHPTTPSRLPRFAPGRLTVRSLGRIEALRHASRHEISS